MSYWAAAAIDRQQVAMFSPTLDSMIGEDHPVRLFDEMLGVLDWSGWEAQYDGRIGQPPIHPRIVARVILYGLSLGIRSSRALERATSNALDFIWLSSGRVIDHATVCGFRTRFGRELKDLFGQIGRQARRLGLIRLNQVALDGTRLKASSSRHGTRAAKSLEGELAALDEQIEVMFAEAEQADGREDEQFGAEGSGNRLPRELAAASDRRQRLAEALAESQARELDKGQPVAVAVGDPDSTIQPNKEGGFAPNYTPLAAADGQIGMIVDSEVLADSDEASQTVATVDRIEENLGAKPEQLLADGAHGCGANLEGLAERGVDAYIPIGQREDRADNPARRADPQQPVAEVDWGKLPVNSRSKTLDRAAFVYDAGGDCYYCPLGHRLDFVMVQDKNRRAGGGVYRLYRCANCVGCPLGDRCVKSKTGLRTISRDGQEPLREAMAAKLASAAGQAVYGRRRSLAETVFGTIKGAMGVRQFLLRGLEKVRIEWTWVCTAFNLAKLARAIGSLRARLAGMIS